MKLKDAKLQVKALGLKLKHDLDFNEYIVYTLRPDEPNSYHTDDLQDAVDTARVIAAPAIARRNAQRDAYHAENRIDYVLEFVWSRSSARVRHFAGGATGWTDSTICTEVF